MANPQLQLLLREVRQHYEDQLHIDFKITTTTEVIGCHRLVLSVSFSYFQQMFNRSPDVSELDLRHLPAEGVKSCIDFAYTGKLTLTLESVEQIVRVGHHLKADVILSACDNFLADRLDKNNAMFGLYIATEYHLPNAKHKAMIEVRTFFTLCTTSHYFLKLEVGTLMKLFSDKKLNVPSEEVVIDALVSWLNHDVEGRKREVKGLLSTLLFRYCSEKYLYALLTDSKYQALATPRFKHLVRQALRAQYGPARRASACRSRFLLSQSKRPHKSNRPRGAWLSLFPRYSFTRKKLVVVGGTTDGDEYQSNVLDCMYWDRARWRWCKFTDLPPHYTTCRTWSVCTGDGRLFVSGGRYTENNVNGRPVWTGSPKVYMWHSNKWTALPSLKHGRWDHGFIYADNKLFCFGCHYAKHDIGNDPRAVCRNELLDMKFLKKDQCAEEASWTRVADIKFGFYQPRLCLLGNNIYIFGSYGCGGIYLRWTGVYNIPSQTWSFRSPAPFRCAAAIAVGDYAFVMGDDHRKEVMKYTPSTDTWCTLSPTIKISSPVPHYCACYREHRPSIVLLDGKIHVVKFTHRYRKRSVLCLKHFVDVYSIGEKTWRHSSMVLPKRYNLKEVSVFNVELGM